VREEYQVLADRDEDGGIGGDGPYRLVVMKIFEMLMGGLVKGRINKE